MTTRMVRSGRSPVITATDQVVMGDGPDIYAHIYREGWRDGCRVVWTITAGRSGRWLAWGRTWTRGGAWVKAIAAAHRPGVTGGAS